MTPPHTYNLYYPLTKRGYIKKVHLRKDNSWKVICIVVIFPIHFIVTYYTSDEREYVSLSNDMAF